MLTLLGPGEAGLAEAFDELTLGLVYSRTKLTLPTHTIQSAPNRNIGTRPENDFTSKFAKHNGLQVPPLILAMEMPSGGTNSCCGARCARLTIGRARLSGR